MGNLCGKQESDPFAQPGRRLDSAPPPTGGTAPVPAKRVGGPPRTLGGGTGGAAATGGGDADDARQKAAAAAEARATKAKPSGKLQEQLDQQRKQTRAEMLAGASEEERRTREMDANTAALNHD